MGDVIVVGGGLCGAALAYELAKQGAAVLLVEAEAEIAGATRHSYGGIAYWAGNTALTQELCRAARSRHPRLSAELGQDTTFRELELLLSVEPGKSPLEIAQGYGDFMVTPEVLTVAEACEREPLLNPQGIGGALAVAHGHVCPLAMTRAYRQAFAQLGGKLRLGRVEGLLRRGGARGSGDRVTGVMLAGERILGQRVILSAGAWSRALLGEQAVALPLYFSQAELLELPAAVVRRAAVQLQGLVMPAEQRRFELEARVAGAAADPPPDPSLDPPPIPPVLDAGVIQFQGGRIVLGQISRGQWDASAKVNAQASEAAMRGAVRSILPAIADLPGQWHSTRVAFSGDGLPLIGPVPGLENLSLFTGFSSPFVYAIPLAERFAQRLVEQLAAPELAQDLGADPWLGAMLPGRFAQAN